MEIIIVIAVSGIMAGLLFGPLNDLYFSNSRGLERTVRTAVTKAALRSIEQRASMSSAFLTTSISDPTRAPWQWTNDGTGKRALITSNYATTEEANADTDNDRKLIYAADCATPLMNNYVYFLTFTNSTDTTGTLYRRLLKASGTCATGPNYVAPIDWKQRQTCGTGYTNPVCQAADAKLLINVESFDVDYYSADDTLLNATGSPPHTDHSDSSAPADAKSIEIRITTRNGDESTRITSKLRIERMNGN